MKISVSILNSEDKKEMIKTLNNTNISYIHMDVMDGQFVPQRTLPYPELKELSGISTKKLDIHLMMNSPEEYIDNIKDLDNIENITIHLEIEKNIKEKEYIENRCFICSTCSKALIFLCFQGLDSGTDVDRSSLASSLLTCSRTSGYSESGFMEY